MSHYYTKAREPSFSYGNSPQNKVRYSQLEFKYLYFKVQSLINKKVTLGLKYEQLKSPELHATLLKPMTCKILEVASTSNLIKRIGKTPHISPQNQGLRFEPQVEGQRPKISLYMVFILLLLRYEYLIQSENDFVRYDLSNTKANVCEILAIRMLREYKFADRVNTLFISPMESFGKDLNTLELCVLSKSKRFLSQPAIIQILDMVYNGELILKNKQKSIVSPEEDYLLEQGIENYRYNRASFTKLFNRSNTVPKYQSLVINLKLIFFTALYFIIVLTHKGVIGNGVFITIVEVLLWIIGLDFNIEFLMKIFNIDIKFLKKIIWNYVDLLLILLIDAAVILRSTVYYHAIFSLISIILLPRILSVFNNYEFFNMIITSFKKMSWKFMGLFCMFICLISGFYISSISLTLNQSNYDIAFDMLKIFFGFTPAVWNNWDNYNELGKGVQMGYLFLMQFVVSTILAIVLSDVFSKVNETNKEEFHYIKSINLIIYLKVAEINTESGFFGNFIINKILNSFKLPIVLLLWMYESTSIRFNAMKRNSEGDLKHFTFLNKDTDYYQDNDLINIDDESDASLKVVKSRKASAFHRRFSQIDNQMFAKVNNLVPAHSISTLGNFKSASTDSLFIDELLAKKYGNAMSNTNNNSNTIEAFAPHVSEKFPLEHVRTNNSEFAKLSTSHVSNVPSALNATMAAKRKRRQVNNKQILRKLDQIELLFNTFCSQAMAKREISDSQSTLGSNNSNVLPIDNKIYNIAEVSVDDIYSINSSEDYNEEDNQNSDTSSVGYGSDDTF